MYQYNKKTQPNSLDTPNNNTLWSLGSTPILIKSISQYLQHYPDRHAAQTLDTGFKEGFKLLYVGPRLPIFSHNLVSANQYPDILQTKISKEVDEGRMVGPFLQPPMPNIHVSPIGLVPKKRRRLENDNTFILPTVVQHKYIHRP